jgi:hypothetical protein
MEGMMMSTSSNKVVPSKKRKVDSIHHQTGRNHNNNNNSSNKKSYPIDESIDDGYEFLTLTDIQERIRDLCRRLPRVPEAFVPTNEDAVKTWASELQTILEEFHLLISCISSATYQWGSERSGAADQHLSILSAELGQSQDQITSQVAPRLTNVLAPVVDLVVDRVVVMTTPPPPPPDDDDDGDDDDDDDKNKDKNKNKNVSSHSNDQRSCSVKQNVYTRKVVDPDFMLLCRSVLCRNAKMLRHVCLANFHKVIRVITDYLSANDADGDRDSRGFSY